MQILFEHIEIWAQRLEHEYMYLGVLLIFRHDHTIVSNTKRDGALCSGTH